MIKSIVSGFVALSVLAMPVAAEARGRDDYYRGGHHRGLNTGEAIALGVGAFILGAAASRNRAQVDERYEPRYEPRYESRYERSCWDAIETRYDYYGRPYYLRVTRCN
jgi:hypothetical protein